MFKIAAEPWGNSMRAEAIPLNSLDWAPRNRYHKHWGYEMSMLNNAAKFMNFKYTIQGPPERKWGAITESGQWNGLLYELVLDNVDWTMGSNLVSYLREQVSDGTTTFSGDYLVLASPRPTYQYVQN